MDTTTVADCAGEDGIGWVRWARPVRQDKLRRLYEADARGIADDALIDDVGCALFLRCRSIVTVTAAVRGQVACPRCGHPIRRAQADNSPRGLAERLVCAACGWCATWEQYRQTFAGQQLYGAGGMEAFCAFLAAFDRARSARDKVFAIDRLVHSFHYNLTAGANVPAASRPAAANVVEGSLADVVAFLDRLSYGEATTPQMRATRAAYEQQMPHTWAGKRYRRPD